MNPLATWILFLFLIGALFAAIFHGSLWHHDPENVSFWGEDDTEDDIYDWAEDGL